jgi:hypothetical protein
MPLPSRLPETIIAPAGPVPVRLLAEVVCEGRPPSPDTEYLGLWQAKTRTILLRDDMSIEQAWLTFWHEWTHAVLSDMGSTLDSKRLEQVCDQMALGLLMLHREWCAPE